MFHVSYAKTIHNSPPIGIHHKNVNFFSSGLSSRNVFRIQNLKLLPITLVQRWFSEHTKLFSMQRRSLSLIKSKLEEVKNNIAPFQSYFHDGSMMKINHGTTDLDIFIESAEICHEIDRSMTLSKDRRIRGVLHLKNVLSIFIDRQPFKGKLKMLADEAGILNFQIHENRVCLFVEWINYSHQKKGVVKFSDIMINVDHVFWENNP